MKALAFAKHYIGYGHQAGAETTLHDTMRLLAEEGWDCTVLLAKAHPGVENYEVDGVSVIVPQTDRDVKNFPFQIFPENDIIITQLSAAGRGGIVAKQHQIPSLHLVHNDHLHNEINSRKYTDFSIYNSEWVRDSWGYPGMVLHPVVDPSRYRVESSRETITLVNLSIGDDCNYNKGYETFYEMAKRFPEFDFLGVQGAYGNQAIRCLPNSEVWPHQEDMKKVYSRTSVLLQPSQYESYGRVPVEGFASGIPCISVPHQGVIEALGDAAEYASFNDFYLWEKQLWHILENYDRYSQKAYVRSNELWERSEKEISEFLTLCEILATDGIEVAHDYLGVP